MMALTFLYIIPRLPATAIAPCKKETPSTSKLCRDRKARRRPTSQRLCYEGVGNHSAGRKRPPAGLFLFWSRNAEATVRGRVQQEALRHRESGEKGNRHAPGE